MDHLWQPGESCVKRGIVNNRVWIALSVYIIKDSPSETILLLLPGAQCAFPEGLWQRKSGNNHHTQSIARSRWDAGVQEKVIIKKHEWLTNRILEFLEPEKYYSTMLFWNGQSNQFKGYYINFQLPYQRSHCGFDSLDLDLDIEIAPSGSWRWKDEDEYLEGIQLGAINDEWARSIEVSKTEVLEKIAHRQYPIDNSWLNWRPDPTWMPPQLPDKWQLVTKTDL
jgi:protein associated with RNAse G/E